MKGPSSALIFRQARCVLCGDKVELQIIDFAEFERRFPDFAAMKRPSKDGRFCWQSRCCSTPRRLLDAVHRQLCCLAEKRRYAGRYFPPFSSLTPLACLKGILWFPYSLYCMAGCAAAVAAIFLYRKLFSQDALTDSERNFDFSAKGTYGTSGWMQPREIPAVLNIVSDLSQHTGTVLGILDGRFLCIPEKTRMNGNLAVYGASGSMKTRSFCMNRILQSAARGESLIICDPKSELYENPANICEFWATRCGCSTSSAPKIPIHGTA